MDANPDAHSATIECNSALYTSMIYISVDNDHQTGLALSLVNHYKIPSAQVKFISHISPRNTIAGVSGISFQPVEVHPLCAGNSFKNPLSYVKSIFHQMRIKKLFTFTPNDILIVTTEYELNNAIFAKEMHRKGGKIYIFDEGIGYYFNNSLFHRNRATALDKLYLILYNLSFKALSIPAYAKKGFEGRMFASIADEYVDCIYSRMRLPIDRPSKVCGYRNLLASNKIMHKNENVAVFFANNLECFGLKEEELKLSKDAIEEMAKNFETVYVKVHPADAVQKNDIFDFYKKLIELHPNLHFIENDITGNEVLEKYRPKIVAGMMGATLFDALFSGCQPIFLFQLLPAVSEFGVCQFTLEKMGYRYIGNLKEIRPDYQCGIDISSLLYEEQKEELWWLTSAHK